MGGICVAIDMFELGAMKIFIHIAGDLCLYRSTELQNQKHDWSLASIERSFTELWKDCFSGALVL